MAKLFRALNKRGFFFYVLDGNDQPRDWIWSCCVVVESIEWPEIIRYICEYCGTIINHSDKCPNCQSQNPIADNTVGNARVVLAGRLPDALFLFDAPEEFVINYADCGRGDLFDNWEFRIVFKTLRICQRWIDSPMIEYEDEVDQVRLRVEVEASVKMEVRVFEQD